MGSYQAESLKSLKKRRTGRKANCHSVLAAPEGLAQGWRTPAHKMTWVNLNCKCFSVSRFFREFSCDFVFPSENPKPEPRNRTKSCQQNLH